MKFAVIDLETNILSPHPGNRASPFYEENTIVLGVLLDEEGNFFRFRDLKQPSLEFAHQLIAERIFEHDILIGHNIKFDLLYLRKVFPKEYKEWVKGGGSVWDTQVVEYILSGQDMLYPSLDAVSEKYGGTVKPDAIKEYWKAGIDTSDIPFNELQEYCDGDVSNTMLIFQEQTKEVENRSIYPLIASQMDALLCLTEIEYNGMYFNKGLALRTKENLKDKFYKMQDKLIDYMKIRLPSNLSQEISPRSPQQLSVVLFGGLVKTTSHIPVLDEFGKEVLYKSGMKKGKVKTKKVTETEKVEVRHTLSSLSDKRKNGYYSTDDETLRKIINYLSGVVSHELSLTNLKEFVEELLEYRKLDKTISTYYSGYLKHAWGDSFIHPNYNQCGTSTGRLSSNHPNMQNLSNKEEE